MSEDNGAACALAAVVLAAGLSTRFGTANKLLADCAGVPVLERTLTALAESRIRSEDCVVVTGADHEQLSVIAARLGMRAAFCPDYADGMGRSLAFGVTGIAKACDGLLVLPGDMPSMTPEVINRVVAAFESAAAQQIVFAATSDGGQSHPVAWPARCHAQLTKLGGTRGGKALMSGDILPVIAVPIDDPSALDDVDTEFDLARHVARFSPPSVSRESH
ncbi:MAG: nucleotidyltransferase family protein [Hyphomicrobium sp.]|nr:nucleotidyltransferase family protein [Hyphomicrobium sp.]